MGERANGRICRHDFHRIIKKFKMSNGKRKVSCVVDCESLKTFQVEYCKMLRENMNSLPRRPQNKKKKKSAAN